jgi:hypothetical protein
MAMLAEISPITIREGFIRCSYAISNVQLDEALERIRLFLKDH